MPSGHGYKWARRQPGKRTDWYESFTDGCDTDGVVGGVGTGRHPGSGDPGLGDGYAPHTSNLLHPEGAEGRGVWPPGTNTDGHESFAGNVLTADDADGRR